MAERIERAEADMIAAASTNALARNGATPGFVIRLAGAVASFTDQDSPLNKVAGLGFARGPTATELDEIEKAFGGLDAPTQVELAHLADPEILALLTERGYRLESFENVLGLALQGSYEPVLPDGIEIRPSGDDEFEAWVDVMADAVAHPDTQGVPWREEFPRAVYVAAERDFAAAGVRRYVALREGVLAGGAADAASARCDVAVITTQPGSKSQQNAQRQGFDLLYTRAVLVKRP